MAYVKKESIIEFITKGLNNPNKTKAFGYDAIEILAEIEYAPAADVVEVKHGEWIWKQLYGEIWSTLVCSECEESEGANKNFDYCPNCGAKMDGRKENNNE